MKLETGDVLPWLCPWTWPGPFLGRVVSKSEEVVERASEAWKNMGEAAAMSENELERETCCPSAVRVFARKLLDCSAFTTRAGLRSVRRAPWSPSPTVGWEYGVWGDGAGGVFVGEGNEVSRRVVREPDRGVTLVLRKVGGTAVISSLVGVE